MENKLIPMTTFVLEVAKQRRDNEQPGWDYTPSDFNTVLKYAEFLKQPLALWMFVHCDEEGKPYDMLEVEKWKEHSSYSNHHKEELEFFEQAKSRVLFEGFEIEQSKSRIGFYLAEYNCIDYSIIKNNFSSPSKYLTTIEDLIIYSGLTLTETAKQIYGS
ncbi:hypothetical protein [Elizabethkingia anophelis]|uniref:hypothetical protein n=1 Tax=Elizabethkingia anophelis TaxID=1117645 RepID=UPI0038914238